MKGYRLKIKRLDFISAVDAGAQGPIANVALIKRAPGGVNITCQVAKLDEKLGLVFGWAMAGTVDGGQSPHIDLQDDAIDISGDDFIKACAEFMEAGAAADVMHDGKADGRVVFAMPLVKQVNDALGIKSDVQGFAIAMKPSPETFKRFVNGELAAFSIGGVGERTPLAQEQKRHLFARIVKEAVMTDVVDGHQHVLDLDDPASTWLDMYSTSYQTLEGADIGHAHAWTFDPGTGVITIGADSGHTHAVTQTVPADVLAAYAALDAKQDADNAAVAAAVMDDPSDGIPIVVASDEESSAKVQINVIAARAPANKSTPPAAMPHGGGISKETTQMDKDAQIVDLTKRLERADRIAKMSGAHKTHFDTLAGEDAEAFLAKSSKDRDAAIADAEKANEVVYTSKSTGRAFRKSDEATGLVDMAKQIDSQAEHLAKATLRAEQVDLEKRAGETIGAFGKVAGVRAAILKAVEGIADEKVRGEAIEAIKGANAALVELGKSKGYVPDGDVTGSFESPLEKFTKAREVFAKAKNMEPRAATSDFLATTEGAQLYAAYTSGNA